MHVPARTVGMAMSVATRDWRRRQVCTAVVGAITADSGRARNRGSCIVATGGTGERLSGC